MTGRYPVRYGLQYKDIGSGMPYGLLLSEKVQCCAYRQGLQPLCGEHTCKLSRPSRLVVLFKALSSLGLTRQLLCVLAYCCGVSAPKKRTACRVAPALGARTFGRFGDCTREKAKVFARWNTISCVSIGWDVSPCFPSHQKRYSTLVRETRSIWCARAACRKREQMEMASKDI